MIIELCFRLSAIFMMQLTFFQVAHNDKLQMFVRIFWINMYFIASILSIELFVIIEPFRRAAQTGRMKEVAVLNWANPRANKIWEWVTVESHLVKPVGRVSKGNGVFPLKVVEAIYLKSKFSERQHIHHHGKYAIHICNGEVSLVNS